MKALALRAAAREAGASEEDQKWLIDIISQTGSWWEENMPGFF